MGNITRISTVGMSREDWLAERKHSLGGSDMGAILGLNQYRSPYSVWAEKLGKIPDEPDNEAMRVGRDLEAYVIERFCEASGKKCHRINAILRNSAFPFIHANVDRVVSGERSGVEAKTASALNERSFTGGEFPASYYAQCVTYLAVTEYQRWYLAVLVLGREFKVYQMTRIPDDICPEWCESSVYVSDEEIAALITAAEEFWAHVEKQTPPPVDGSEATKNALSAIYSEPQEIRIDLSAMDQVLVEYLRLKAQEKELKLRMEDAANRIRAYMGDASSGKCDAGTVSWKNQARSSIDTNALKSEHPEIDLSKYTKVSVSRVFKVTPAKAK